MMVFGGGFDPLKLKFNCNRCKPQVKITLLEVHPEHLPKRLMIHKPWRSTARSPGTLRASEDESQHARREDEMAIWREEEPR
ncbi:hypothetical protein [Mesorhizobium sp. CO1-1-8]|uniref:hypothetical protein n=1 Tax=Mesorhizobium sp. CO1-1-8 TaxID=2876631 RepID=UPI001CD154E9|nr:hypothetical protein [Mesorhizobium sp. CO1-1-8]MBZ9774992.1 hypothetical protein [Mesorhizobium sp. CO1-1-8]